MPPSRKSSPIATTRLVTQQRITNVGGPDDELVDASALGIHEIATLLAEGRLLAWERDSTCDDGVGEAETNGFLDGSDMPPWDTWVAYDDCSDRDERQG